VCEALGCNQLPGKVAVGDWSPKATQAASPRAGESETFAPKSAFCHAGPSWLQAKGVNRGKDAALGWMSHAEGLCWGRRAPTIQQLLPVCQEALLGWVLLLANQQLTPDIINWEELKAKEGCQDTASSTCCNAIPCLEAEKKQTSCHHP